MNAVSRLLDTCASLALFPASEGFPDAITGHGFINLLAGTDDLGDTSRQQWARMVWSASATGDKWREDELQRVALLVELHFTRRAAADWLRSIGETRDTLRPEVLAWIGDQWQGAGIIGRRQERIRQIITQLKQLDPDLSPDAMPGTKADFLTLCKALDPKLFPVGVEAFKDAIEGVCQFKRGARSGSYYADMLPKLGVSASSPKA